MRIRDKVRKPATLGGVVAGLAVSIAGVGIAAAATQGPSASEGDGVLVEGLSAEPDVRSLRDGDYVYTLDAHPNNPNRERVEVRIEVHDAGTSRCIDVASNGTPASSSGSCGEGDLEGVYSMAVGSLSVDGYGWMAMFGIVKNSDAESVLLH